MWVVPAAPGKCKLCMLNFVALGGWFPTCLTDAIVTKTFLQALVARLLKHLKAEAREVVAAAPAATADMAPAAAGEAAPAAPATAGDTAPAATPVATPSAADNTAPAAAPAAGDTSPAAAPSADAYTVPNVNTRI